MRLMVSLVLTFKPVIRGTLLVHFRTFSVHYCYLLLYCHCVVNSLVCNIFSGSPTLDGFDFNVIAKKLLSYIL